MRPILEVKDLRITFDTKAGRLQAIRGVDFQLERGKTLAIVGESGSGKSVTVRAIMGIQSRNQKAEGQILYRCGSGEQEHEYDILAMRKGDVVRQICGKHIAMVFQDPMTALDPTMTIGAQIAEAVRVHQPRMGRETMRQRVLELMTLVGIERPAERMGLYPHNFSGGMRQRSVLAMALAGDPAILFADEPTTALDVTIQAQILDLLRQIQQQLGTATVFVTHDLGAVARVADRVAVMYAGKIVEIGTAEEIFYDPRHPYTWGLLQSLPALSRGRETLPTIPGMPPDLLHPPKGDAFACRNPYALDIDYEEEPPMFPITETHFAATWLLDPRALQVVPPVGGGLHG